MYRCCLFFLLLVAFTSCKNDFYATGVEYDTSDTVYRIGDDQRWAAQEYNDAGWKTELGPTGNRVFWARTPVLLQRVNTSPPLGVKIRAFGAFEVYWDGVLLGRNGRPATATQPEIPGTEASDFMVPDALATPGLHLVALRATRAHPGGEGRRMDVTLHSYMGLVRRPLIVVAFMNIMAGAFLMVAVYYLFLFVSGSSRKEYAVLVFSSICFLFFCLLVLEFVKFYVAIPYPKFYLRLQVIDLLTFAIALLVPLYFAIQFDFPRKGLLVGSLLVVFLGTYLLHPQDYDLTTHYFSSTMFLATLVIVGKAVSRRAKGSLLMLVGLVASVVVNYYLFYDFALYIGFTIIVLCMLYLHAIRVRGMEQEHQAALLLSSRLKLELLKKNIQPHFIKNTLTSLLDWVEESPGQGAVFIQALAREFDLLNEMAEATLIPVSQEIELCRQHLQVMQFRKEIRYELEQAGIEPDDLIPPAIFHTVLENGITHSLPPADGRIRFQLSFERCDQYKKYRLLTCAPARPAEKWGKAGRGTGFQYIAARLKESYGTGWEFHSAAVPEGWLTSITIARAP